jgi:hypothetical protein
LVYSTYLGGNQDDVGLGIAVDSSGSAYVTGYANSANFPTVNSFQSVLAGPQDAFVAQLNSTGSALVYSTYLGGSGGDAGYGIAVDNMENAYIIGVTNSNNFPVVNPIQPTYGGGDPDDAFVAKIASCSAPPVVTVSANPTMLWPPNGEMLPVTVSGAITDACSGVNASTAVYSVTDEYGEVQPSGPVTLGAGGSYSFAIPLQASRSGTDKNGRTYTITVSAKDNAGNLGSASTVVTVPHDQGH